MKSYDLGNRLYELRKQKGLSQKELGAMLGVSNKAVSKWETGAAAPKTENIIKLSEIFGITPEELLCGKSDDENVINKLSHPDYKVDNEHLKAQLEQYEIKSREDKYKRSKIYLITNCSLYIAFVAVFFLINKLNPYIMQFAGTENPDVFSGFAFTPFLDSLMVCGVFTGFFLVVRFIKRVPTYAIIMACIAFPITFILIEIAGVALLIPTLIFSLKTVMSHKREISANAEKDLKIIIAIALVAVSVISITNLSNEGKGDLFRAISSKEQVTVGEFYAQLDIDENYLLCVYSTYDNEIGVSYLKKLGEDKYNCKISYIGDLRQFKNDDDEYYLISSGVTEKINFTITQNDSDFDNYTEHLPLYIDEDDVYYFCYSTDDAKYHFSNQSGIKLNK